MSRRTSPLFLVIGALVIVAGLLIGLILTDTISLGNDRAPRVPAQPSAPALGSTVTIFDDAGDPALVFVTSDFSSAAAPAPDSDQIRSWVTVGITNRTTAPVRMSPNTMLGFIDTWGAYQSIDVVDASDTPVSSAAFNIESEQTISLRLRVQLPSTSQPDLLVFDRASHFAVLVAFNGAVDGVGQTVMTAAIPTTDTSWLAPQSGELTVTDLQSAARTTGRGIRIWKENTQTAAITLTFHNIQDGRTFWSPDRVSVVDRLGRVYVAYPGPVSAEFSTPDTTGTISPYLVPANTTVRLTLSYDVPPGTEMQWAVIGAGRAEHVVAITPTGEPTLAYSNDLVQMLDLASTNCAPYSDWSNRAHEALATLDSVLSADMSAITPGQLRELSNTLRSEGSALVAADTPEQKGFSESEWLEAIMVQTADKLDAAAGQLDLDPSLSPAVGPSTIDDLVAMRDQFATRLGTLDGFISTGCGDLFG
jgi:hypothetical protein